MSKSLNLGFDGKRALENSRGLGSYSRTLLYTLGRDFPENEYHLFSTGTGNLDWTPKGSSNYFLHRPQTGIAKRFPGIWRSFGSVSVARKNKIDLYHGLSGEIPIGLWRHKIKAVVTIHDLMFLTQPAYYKRHDRFFYKQKTIYACRNADQILATSRQTAMDLTDYLEVKPERIQVVYQSCHPLFLEKVEADKIEAIRKKYLLPHKYLLYVGAIEPKKNLRRVIESLKLVKAEEKINLVFAGTRSVYVQELIAKAEKSGLENQVFFPGYIEMEDLPALYQGAKGLFYPSFQEGFGIPLVEAMFSGLKIITTGGSVFREIAGDFGHFCDADSSFDFSVAMRQVWEEEPASGDLLNKMNAHKEKFHPKTAAKRMMELYREVMLKDTVNI